MTNTNIVSNAVSDPKQPSSKVSDETRTRQEVKAEVTKAILAKHKDEFDALYEKACADKGIPPYARLTGVAKAKQDLANLIAQYGSDTLGITVTDEPK
jgi:hypothetical protein